MGPSVLPTVNAFQPTFQPDFFAASSGFAGALAADGSGFDYLTWGIGATAKAVAVDPAGDATFIGEQGGAAQLTSPGEFDIPTTPGAFQPLPAGGGSNIFVRPHPRRRGGHGHVAQRADAGGRGPAIHRHRGGGLHDDWK